MANASIFYPSPTDPTVIGELEVDILFEQEYNFESEVTEHPVEEGFPIHDHVIRKPIELNCIIGIAVSPVTWLDRTGFGNEKLTDAAAEFKRIYQEAQAITIVTQDLFLENMLMTSATITKNEESKKVLKIPCTFKQIRKVNVKTVDIPQNIVDIAMIERAGESESAGGEAQTQSISTDSGGGDGELANEAEETRSSTLYDIVFG